MTDAKNGGLPPALVETIAGLSAGTLATMVVHPLDIVKTRMQLNQSKAGAKPPLSTITLAKSLLQSQHPIAAIYRGITPNLIGNATSWASFFFLKSHIEGAIVTFRSNVEDGMQEYNLSDGSNSSAQLTPADYFLSSGLAGVGVQVFTNPIWVIKTRMLSSDRSSPGAYPSMMTGVVRLYRQDGCKGFYRGLGASLIGITQGAVHFAVYEPVKNMYFARRRAASDQGEHMTNEATLVISTLSKFIAGTVTYPYQVVRSRLQNYDAEARFGKGITGVARRLWREAGIRGFYRGLVPSVIRFMPGTWVTFLVYENVKYHLPRWVEQ